MALVTYRIDLQYDGGDFSGWARQPGLPSVEESLQGALRTVLGIDVQLTVAGRTDAGVHARRQVADFSVPDEVLLKRGVIDSEAHRRLLFSLNQLTPPGLAVTAVGPSPGFDARRDVHARSYRYFIWREEVPSPFVGAYSWHVPGALDHAAMTAATELMVGSHDFTAFTPTETQHVVMRRTLTRCRWRSRGPVLWLEVRAHTFMRHMVRTIAGTLIEVGRGIRSVDDVALLLEGAARSDAGPTAPAHGLFLWRVHYGE